MEPCGPGMVGAKVGVDLEAALGEAPVPGLRKTAVHMHAGWMPWPFMHGSLGGDRGDDGATRCDGAEATHDAATSSGGDNTAHSIGGGDDDDTTHEDGRDGGNGETDAVGDDVDAREDCTREAETPGEGAWPSETRHTTGIPPSAWISATGPTPISLRTHLHLGASRKGFVNMSALCQSDSSF